MKTSNQYLPQIAATAILVLGVSVVALAAGGYGPGWGMHRGMMGGPYAMPGGGPGWMMGGADPAATSQQLDRLKQTLGITPAQESAWEDYATAVTTRAALMSGHRQAMFNGDVSPGQMQQFHQSGFAQMQQLTAARRHLQAVLTPDQRARTGSLMGGWGGRW